VKVGALSKYFQAWNIILLLVFALLAFAVVRWRLARRIAAALGPGKILLTAPALLEPLHGRASGDGPSGGEHPGGRGLLVLLAQQHHGTPRRPLEHVVPAQCRVSPSVGSHP